MRKILLLVLTCAMLLCTLLSSCSGDNRDHANDAPVYSSRELCGNMAFYKINGSSLRRSLITETNKWYEACTDPTCPHNKEGVCPAFSLATSYTLTVPREDSIMPIVYMFGANPDPMTDDNGVVITYKQDTDHCRTRVFDTSTGEGYDLAVSDFSRVNGAWYTNGKIYLSVEYNTGGFPFDRVGMLDTETGEYSELKGLDTNVEGIGISDGRFYFMSKDGVLHSCDLSLDNVRDEYNCGISEKVRADNITSAAYVDSGVLYFEKNCRTPEEIAGDVYYEEGSGAPERLVGNSHVYRNFFMISDVYCVNLRDKNAEETLVAKNVCEFKPYQGDLYYTLWNFEDRGWVDCPDDFMRNIILTDGGTLYLYNHTDMTSKTVVSDCGTSFYRLNDISDKYVMFEGMQYDIDDFIYERTTDMCYFCNERCVLDLETGEWHVVNNTFLSDDEEGLEMFR